VAEKDVNRLSKDIHLVNNVYDHIKLTSKVLMFVCL
jgi:hypothetical protein